MKLSKTIKAGYVSISNSDDSLATVLQSYWRPTLAGAKRDAADFTDNDHYRLYKVTLEAITPIKRGK